jgi:hypothetical protein
VATSIANSGVQAGDGQVSFCIALAGTPGSPNCRGQSVNALQTMYGGSLATAAQALGFASVPALMAAVAASCGG